MVLHIFWEDGQRDISYMTTIRVHRQTQGMICTYTVRVSPDLLSSIDISPFLGSLKKRFRSINEFIPHAIWLMDQSATECTCKYCARRTQKEVTAAMVDVGILQQTPSTSGGPTRNKSARERTIAKARDPLSRLKRKDRAADIYAAVSRKLTQVPLKKSANVGDVPILAERVNDVRAVNQTEDNVMDLRRWFREGEIVWCSLDKPIPSKTPDTFIQFWPGVVDESDLKVTPLPREQAGSADDEAQASGSTLTQIPVASTSTAEDPQVPGKNGDKPRGPYVENPPATPWVVRQSIMYKIRLLAVDALVSAADEKVLPYQAYTPVKELLEDMVNHPAQEIVVDRQQVAAFDPCPEEGRPSFGEAVGPYAVAIQIASLMASTWCLTDDYQVKVVVPPVHEDPPPKTPSVPPTQPPLPVPASPALSQAPQTLQQAIELASAAQPSVPSTPYKEVASLDPSLAPEELGEVTQQILGSWNTKSGNSDTVKQTRFQGMWWGSERIWVDDFIRLKVPRGNLAPEGSKHVYEASPAGPSAVEEWKKLEADTSNMGAASRGVFMRLDGLVSVDVPTEDGGTVKEARAYGMFYELADMDWEGNDPSPLPAHDQDEVTVPPVSTASLPLPPIGYVWRPILTPGFEATICLGLISGRYYPRILYHPALLPTVCSAMSNPTELGGPTTATNLWALEGLATGFHNTIDPTVYKTSREMMLIDADKEAFEKMQEHVGRRLNRDMSSSPPS